MAVASAYHGILHFSLAGPSLSLLQDGHVPAAIQQYGECIAAMVGVAAQGLVPAWPVVFAGGEPAGCPPPGQVHQLGVRRLAAGRKR